MYRQHGPVVLRASAFTSEAGEHPWPDLTGDHADAAWLRRRWISAVWSRPGIAEAVEVASPGLASQVHAIVTSPAASRDERRVAVALARYLLRMRHRATPFGLFAGVAVGRVGSALSVRWGSEHQPVTRADSQWLADVITRLETCSELLRRLTVTADQTSAVRDGRLEMPCQQTGPGGTDVAPRRVSIRHTAAVQAVMTAAATPVLVGDMAVRLARDYPGRPACVIDAMLADLIRHQFLHTCLRAPMTVFDGLAHLNSQLAAAAADEIAAVAPAVRELREIERLLAGHAGALPAKRPNPRVTTRDRMLALSDIADQPVITDLLLDCTLVLHRAVAAEAEAAAAVLTRLSPDPRGTAAWRDYHARFLRRYGPGAAVPVREVTDPHTGLGFPAGYRGSVLRPPASPSADRDQRILAIAQLAALDGVAEVVLSDQMVADLAIESEVREPAHLDLCFQLHAPSCETVRNGEFTVAVVSFSPVAGSTVGRFLGLAPPAEHARLAAAYAEIPADDEAVRAQVSCPPLAVRTENVSRSPAIWPVISLCEYNDRAGIQLSDLAVTADTNRLRMVSMSTGRTVEPVTINTVEAANHAHPLARFLCEIPRSRTAVLGPFPWGQARRLPFLPRIRYRKAVLSPATWRIDATILPGLLSPGRHWEEDLAACRARLRIPSAVYVGDGDRRLRLDLDDPAQSQLLRAALERAGHALLREAPGPEAFGWLDGRGHEITLTVASSRLDRAPHRQPVPGPVIVGREHGHLPGASLWASARLHAQPHSHTKLLTEHVRAVLLAVETSCWWYVRHDEPQPHLRVRIKLPGPGAFAHVVELIGGWASEMRGLGLISDLEWDTYYPKTGRFGTGPTLAAAEDFFAADSAAAIAEMAGTAVGAPHPLAVVAASLVDLAVSFAGSTATGTRWLIEHGKTGGRQSVARPLRDDVVRLANPDGDFASLRQSAGGEPIVRAWTRRRQALDSYADELGLRPGPDPDLVLRSLLGLHLRRVHVPGLGNEYENTCWHLARSAALAWTARQETALR